VDCLQEIVCIVRRGHTLRLDPRRALVVMVMLWLTGSVSALAQSRLLSRDEALAAVYPGAELQAERVFLTDEQIQRAQELSGGEPPPALVARYVARRNGQLVGRAYVDTHVVRTKRQSLLVSLDPNGRVRLIDVTAVLEPPEYRAPEQWLQQYDGQRLSDDLALQRAIRPIAGGTLTANAANAAVRRVLAIDQVLEGAHELPELGAGTRGR